MGEHLSSIAAIAIQGRKLVLSGRMNYLNISIAELSAVQSIGIVCYPETFNVW
ncbi:MAG: hypothetical protein H0S77_07765 [Spirochaetaceae bacterium]|jgi:hypothetical protein|nr:hypothetical protein [Spirochaetaceae bacterium]MDN5334000.1 hypothetical protein [Sphaerochaeta sp.]